jgi:hypothetical protein
MSASGRGVPQIGTRICPRLGKLKPAHSNKNVMTPAASERRRRWLGRLRHRSKNASLRERAMMFTATCSGSISAFRFPGQNTQRCYSSAKGHRQRTSSQSAVARWSQRGSLVRPVRSFKEQRGHGPSASKKSAGSQNVARINEKRRRRGLMPASFPKSHRVLARRIAQRLRR